MKPTLCALSVLLVLPAILALPVGANIVIQFDAAAYEPFRYNPDSQRELIELDHAVKDFERRNPGVRVEYVRRPAIDAEQWLTTRFMSNDAPEIVNLQAEFVTKHIQKGWFVPLDPYLDRPNPHVEPGRPGSEHWLDQFYKDATDARRSSDGRLYVIPYDQVGTAIFYNKDHFAQVGVTSEDDLPKNWSEFIELQQRLKDAGIIPFCMTGGFNMRFNWFWRIIMDQLYDELLPEIDIQTDVSGGFAGVDNQEFVRAYQKGIIRVDSERFLTFFHLLRQWEPYWQPGHLGDGDDKLFRLGHAAMFWDGSWAIGHLDNDMLRTFDYGVMAFPGLTTQDTPYVTDQGPRSVGGATAIQWAVTDTARQRGRLDLVIDLLRTITAPKFAGPIISEAELFPPNIKDVDTSPKMTAFLEDLESGHVMFGDRPELGGALGDRWFRTIQSWVGGRYTEEELVRQLRAMFDGEVERLLETNQGVWRFDEDWEILPVEGVVAGDLDGNLFHWEGVDAAARQLAQGGQMAGMDVDRKTRVVYWCDPEMSMIRSVGLDGGDAPRIAWSGLSQPRDLVIDSARRVLYWIESGMIRQATLPDGEPSTLLAIDAAHPAHALALDVDDGALFWSIPARGTIQRVTYAHGPRARRLPPVGAPDRIHQGRAVTGLTFDRDSRLLYFADQGALYRAEAPKLRIPTQDGRIRYATETHSLAADLLFHVTGTDIRHVSANHRAEIFWSDSEGVHAANVDGTDPRRLTASNVAPSGLVWYGPAEPQPLPQTSMLTGYMVFIGVVAALMLAAMFLRPNPAAAWRHAWRKRVAYAFIAPTFLLLFGLAYYPIIAALLYAFTEWSPTGQVRYIGLANFIEVFTDPVIRESVGNLIIITIFGLTVGVIMPLLAAELIFNLRSTRAQYWYRVLFVVPMVVPGVVMLLVWQLMYDYNLGVFNRMLTVVGLPAFEWLSSPRLALYSLILIGFPFVGGFGMLIYYAGLQNIPKSVLESASLDGASGFSRFFYFDLPLVMGQVKLMLVFSVIGAIQGFQNQLIVTAGGPGYSTMVPGLHMYQNAMQFDRMGMACAIGTVLFIVILTLTVLNLKYLKSSTEFEAN